jgi:hypothetical protein
MCRLRGGQVETMAPSLGVCSENLGRNPSPSHPFPLSPLPRGRGEGQGSREEGLFSCFGVSRSHMSDCVMTRFACHSEEVAAAPDEESRIALKMLRARFLVVRQ